MVISHGEPLVNVNDEYPEPYLWKEFRMEPAIRHRTCLKCKNTIIPGEKCLKFRYGSSYYKVTANLCRNCMLRMVHE